MSGRPVRNAAKLSKEKTSEILKPQKAATKPSNKAKKPRAPKKTAEKRDIKATEETEETEGKEVQDKVSNAEADKKETANGTNGASMNHDASISSLNSKKAKNSEGPTEISTGIPENTVLKDHEDKDVDLYKLNKQSGIVIFTYPKASTPGCTKQVCFFRDTFKEFETKGYQVFGLSNDKPDGNKKFATAQKLQYKLLCDPEQKFLKFLGVSVGPGKGASRSAFVISKNGTTIKANIKVGPEVSKDWALTQI